MKKNILVLGGTGFFGIYAVNRLLENGHQITIATRGKTKIPFNKVSHIPLERTCPDSIATALKGKNYDIIVDNLVFCSNDVKYLLDVAQTDRYVYSSTIAVYDENLQMDMSESHFDPLSPPLIWCDREELPYGERKRHAERAVFQTYSHIPAAAIRIPYVIGEDDFTKRLYFYVEHVVKGLPMFIDNMEEPLGYIFSEEAGEFLAWVTMSDILGVINGSGSGTVSVGQIIDYVEQKTGKKAILDPGGEPGAYNNRLGFSSSVSLANELGFEFTSLFPRFYKLLDHYIDIASV